MSCLYLKIDANRRKVVQHHREMFPFNAWGKFSLNSRIEARKKLLRNRVLIIYCFIIINLLICASLSRIVPEIGNNYLISVGLVIFSSSIVLYAVWTTYTKPNVMILSPNKRYYYMGEFNTDSSYELIWTKNGKYIEIYYNSNEVTIYSKYLKYYLNLTKVGNCLRSALLPFNSNGFVPLCSIPTKELQVYLGTILVFSHILSDQSEDLWHSCNIHAMEKGSEVSDSRLLISIVDIIEGTSHGTLMPHITAMRRNEVLHMLTQDEIYKKVEPEVLTT